MQPLMLVGIGAAVGVLSGLIGVGGGVVLVPVFVYLLGMSQHQAQGTSLAILIPPIGILAAWTYYRQGHVDLRVAALICLGFVFGGLFGAKIATALPSAVLKRIFGVSLMAIGLKMALGR